MVNKEVEIIEKYLRFLLLGLEEAIDDDTIHENEKSIDKNLYIN